MQSGVERTIDQQVRYYLNYLKKDGKYYTIKSQHTLLNHFKDKKKELQQYIKQNKLRYGESKENDLQNNKTGLQANNITTYLAVLNKRLQLYSSTSNEKGQESFFTKKIYGTPDIVIKTNTPQDSLFQISISTPFLEKLSWHKLRGYYLTDGIWQTLLPQSISMQTQNIYVANKLQRFYQPPTDSSTFYRKPYK